MPIPPAMVIQAVMLAREAFRAVSRGDPTDEQLEVANALKDAKVDAAVAEIDKAIEAAAVKPATSKEKEKK